MFGGFFDFVFYYRRIKRFGSWEEIFNKLRDYEGGSSSKFSAEEVETLRSEKNKLEEEFTALRAERNSLGELVSGLGDEGQIEALRRILERNSGVSGVEDILEKYSEAREKIGRMETLEGLTEGEDWILDRLEEKLKARRLNAKRNHEIDGKKKAEWRVFEIECEDVIRRVFENDHPNVQYCGQYPEDYLGEFKRRDFIIDFFTDDKDKYFEVVVECKCVSDYYKKSPIHLLPPSLSERGEVTGWARQLRDAEKSLETHNTKRLNIVVVSASRDHFDDLNIPKRTNCGALVVDKFGFESVLMALRGLRFKHIPVLNIRDEQGAYTNPEFADALRDVLSNLWQWKQEVESGDRIMDSYMEHRARMRNWMDLWEKIFQKLVHKGEFLLGKGNLLPKEGLIEPGEQ